ncbi:MAG TPA: hypothetical protein DD381_13720 [Lentisphaeria bacterium]|nr:MAG: hypothetical protein A2X47_13810 [Lentisphaerae bacterium GWF2_38_69]HBM17380.1 hypothetical protein [Lentisphaeria bacterium]
MFKKLFSVIPAFLILVSLQAANSKTPDLEKNKQTLDSLYSSDYETFTGNKDAKVVIFDFFDYNCGDCKDIFPKLQELIKNNPDLKIVSIEYPILRPPAMYAAKVAIAALSQGKYDELHRAFMSRQGRFASEDEVNALAQNLGVDVSKVKTDDTIKQYLLKNLELGHKIGITNVPNLFIGKASEPHNTSVIVEPKPDELQALINKYLNKE